ncbi:hypothetical protein HPB47_019708 [Ixodes persulcatus]|uniref:Uncharacterized protein n=1 Tax=Ixodes persulcatus TaxID=34615 RepID=A0AC60QJF5_IXOPE|nr:hypothetical protein HPB47_019708 [Ixodes persulcatus]
MAPEPAVSAPVEESSGARTHTGQAGGGGGRPGRNASRKVRAEKRPERRWFNHRDEFPGVVISRRRRPSQPAGRPSGGGRRVYAGGCRFWLTPAFLSGTIGMLWHLKPSPETRELRLLETEGGGRNPSSAVLIYEPSEQAENRVRQRAAGPVFRTPGLESWKLIAQRQRQNAGHRDAHAAGGECVFGRSQTRLIERTSLSER